MKENSLYIQYVISLLFQINATLHARKIALKKQLVSNSFSFQKSENVIWEQNLECNKLKF